MYNFPSKCLLFILAIASGNNLYAQTSSTSNPNTGRENDPYSKYGIGELWNGNSTAIKAMGNVTSAFRDPFLINSDNPASYSSLLITTFEGGAIASSRNITSSGGLSQRTGTSSLGYLNIGIPVNRNAGISFGLRPYAHSYYALVDTSVTPIGQTIRSYAGDGSLSYAYLGGAYSYKGISIGANFGYLFGSYRNFVSVIPNDTLATNRAYETEFAKYNKYGGIYWKAGFTYEHKLRDSNYTFRVGGTLTLGQNLNEKVNNYKISLYSFGDTTVNDTSYNSGDQKGKLTLPVSYSIGIMIARNDKWAFGADYAASNWSNFKSTPDSTVVENIGAKSYKASFGGEYTPNAEDLKNYFARVTYRFGLYFGKDYVRLQNTSLPVYGLTFGGSFPYRRNTHTHSRLHASFDIGRIGTQSNNLLQQTYVRFGLGLSFNQAWFQKRKYD